MQAMRIGIGHDTHRLIAGGPLILGGTEIPFDHRLEGHSDADAVLHAITDALLGAAGMGDIGDLFPDDAPENAGRDSAEMLKLAWSKISSRYRIANIDCIVFAQRPKISPYKAAMRARIAGILQLDPQQVNVKAKTGEHVGPVGRGEAMMAECIALLIDTQDA
ncbi:MAG: 2-C-methyl-D-erythritol 2,4-cyclodiphosphate synthase [Planctomycetota bacterium]